MVDYSIIEVAERPYLYVERTSGWDLVSQAMGQAYGDLVGFMRRQEIAPVSPPLAVYYTYDPNQVTFRAGFFVDGRDADKAEGDVKADVTPAGRVAHLTHVGPYSALRITYEAVMRSLKERGIDLSAPTWEVYVDDPEQTPEASLRTDIHMALA